MKACPSQEQLQAFASGDLPENTADGLLAHLATCADCRLALNSKLYSRHTDKRTSVDPDPILNEPAFQRAVAEIRQIDFNRAMPDGQFANDPSSSKDDTHDFIGKQFDQYHIVAKIGEGSMGTVYKAVHIKLNKQVALKILPGGKLASSERVARFEREMLSIGRLNHPHIVGATDAREIDGSLFLVMEYLEGIDLSALCKRFGATLPIGDACEMIRQAAVGLQAAHQHDLIHRDIKPSNLMLTTEGQIKILDLGLALTQDQYDEGDQLTSTGQVMGTVDYIAPEQIDHSHAVDIRADLYSLGCTLYKLLTGRAPFGHLKSSSTYQLMKAHIEERAQSVSQHRPEVPKELVAIVDRLLAKNPAERFKSPQQLADALQPFAVGSDLVALARSAQPDEKRETTINSNSSDTLVSILSSEAEASSTPQSRRAESPQDLSPVDSLRGEGHHAVPLLKIMAVAAIFLLLAAVVIRLATNKGEVTIKSYDPSMEIIVKRNERVVDQFEVGTRSDSTSYIAGEYEIEIKGGQPNGTTIKNRRFKLTRNQTVLVEIAQNATAETRQREQGAGRISPPVADIERKAARWVLSRGGQVRILGRGNEPVLITHVGSLPAESFHVTQILLSGNSQVKNDDLSHLRELKKPERLMLDHTQISDSGLKHLAGLKSLKELRLIDTQVTAKGVAKLKQSLPNCRIFLRSTSNSVDPNRDAAEQILNVGGTATVRLNQTAVQLLVPSGEQLPSQPFEIEQVDLQWGHLKTKSMPDDLLHSLSSLSHLNSINLKDAGLNDRSLALLTDLPQLIWLDVGLNELTDDALAHVAQFESLQMLMLNGTQVSDEGLHYLKGLAHLNYLRLDDTQVSDPGLLTLKQNKKLRSLYLVNTSVTNAGMRHFQEFAELNILDLRGTAITDEGLAELRHCKSLEVLVISGPFITADGLERLRHVPSLKQLKLYDYKVSRTLFAKLAQIKSLESLRFSGHSNLSDEDLHDLPELPNLMWLIVSGPHLTDQGFKELIKLKKLQILSIGDSQISDIGLADLHQLKELRELSIKSDKITDAGCEALARLSQLERLSLSSTTVTEPGVNKLAGRLPNCVILLDGKRIASPTDR